MDQLADDVHTPKQISQSSLQRFILGLGDNVLVLTSNLSGMGKTEEITKVAFSHGKLYV